MDALIYIAGFIFSVWWLCDDIFWKPKRKAKEQAERTEYWRQTNLAQAQAAEEQERHRKEQERHRKELEDLRAKERAESDRRAALAIAQAAEEQERRRKELEDLRQTPTSSTSFIHGRRIAHQIKMIAVDNHHQQDAAEHDFFSQVRACGGTGVINMRVRRQRGGFVSIQGDAVVLEKRI